MRLRGWMAALGCAMAFSACDRTSTVAPTTSAGVGSTSLPPASVDVPQATVANLETTGSAAEQLDWYLNVLNGTATLTEESVGARFSEPLQSKLPFEPLVGLTNQLITAAPLALGEVFTVPETELDIDAGDVEAVDASVLSSSGVGFTIRIAVDGDGRISDLNVEPSDTPELTDEPSTLQAAAADLEPYGEYRWSASRVNFDGDRVEDVDCQSIEGDRAREPTAIGYASKIWLLGALADAVEANEVAWDTEVPLKAESISLAPGILQERPVDSPVRLGDAAKLLFESSDNTAADVILLTLGRERVEQAQRRWGNTNAVLNVPFMTTREMAVLKTSTAQVQDEYLAADVDRRRELLAEFDMVPLEDIPVDVFLKGPIRPDVLSWFASPNDLCTGLARLMWAGMYIDGLDPITDIITSNHGVPSDAQWSEIAYKGGIEPGMLTMAWVMGLDTVDASGEDITDWYGFVGNLVNADDKFDTANPTLLFAAGRDLVATQPPDSDSTPQGAPSTAGNSTVGNGSLVAESWTEPGADNADSTNAAPQ